MIGTIRKHSKWLWAVIITLTVISFIYWGAAPAQRGGGRGGSANYGSIYGKEITAQQYQEAFNEFKLFYLFHYNAWPEKANVSELEMERETYVRLLLIAKAEDLGIHVGVDAAATAAGQMLRLLGRDGQTVTPEVFTTQVLPSEGLTMADFQNFARHDVVIQQLVQTLGQPGELVTPQEAAAAYVRERQELSAQMVYFSASNYLSSVRVTPDGLGKFYTNYLAAYRLPDRVQINYVEFGVSNYLAQSKAEWAKTNFEENVDAYYQQNTAQFADAKTPEEAKVKIRELLIRQRALFDARDMANGFAAAVFKIEPARAENLATVAKEKGLTVQTTAPFATDASPQEFTAPEGFAKVVATLTPDEPFANPVVGPDGVYVIALAKQIESTIPPFDQIREHVTQDYQMQQAVALARAAGTNFTYKLMISMAAGKSFSATCTSDGLQPQTLPPFSLSTRELPELGGRIELNQLKQTAFTTVVGHASNFEETGDGGFILFVQSQLPVDPSAMRADLPQFTATLRRQREQEAFNEWLNAEANRELGNTPFAKRAMAQ
jgi:peptidyl-prolyl cis-trans isomerase D